MRLAPLCLLTLSFLVPSLARAKPKAGVEGALFSNDEATALLALSEVWGTWNEGDPADVETLIRSVRERSPVRRVQARAEILTALAERRRGDFASSLAHFRSLGFVEDWKIVGPFDNDGRKGLATMLGPETSAQEPWKGKEREVRWRKGYVSSDFLLDFGTQLRPAASTCAFARTTVTDASAKSFQASFGTSGAFTLYWNGQKAFSQDTYPLFFYDRYAIELPNPKAGSANELVVKVCGDQLAPGIALRVERLEPKGAAAASGKESKNTSALKFDAETLTTTPIASATSPAKNAFPVSSPLLDLAKRANSKSAADEERYARFLVATNADDATENLARKYSRMAAERSPTPERAIFAGEQAEDKNQRNTWFEKAIQLSKSSSRPEDNVLAEWARAEIALGRPNRIEAYRAIDGLLAKRSGDHELLLEKTTLLSEIGMNQTATAQLDGALRRSPRSHLLLRSLEQKTTELSRVAEGDKYAERASWFRYDDRSHFRKQISLSIARDDRESALYWMNRLDEAFVNDPAIASELASYAEVLGDFTLARAFLKRALTLRPEDVDTLRSLADLEGRRGAVDEQGRLLRQIIAIQPQNKDAREYLAHLSPPTPKADEAFAVPAKEFLANSGKLPEGIAQRTLVNLQVTTVFENGLANRFHQMVYQPLTESASTSAREYAFTFEEGAELVELRGARVYRKDGTIDESFETGEGAANNPSMNMYTNGRTFYVRFPRLHPGDIVELKYRVEDIAARNDFADYFGEITYLQSREPIARAEYVLVTPKGRAFHVESPNLPGLKSTVTESPTERIYKFRSDNVPELRAASFEPPFPEAAAQVHVSTYRTWDEVGRWYLGLIRDQFDIDNEVRATVKRITFGLTDERAKINAVYKYVVEKTRYVALEFGIHGYKPYRCSQIFARGFGDCKDKATLIVSMLRELGIGAEMVLVRTGMRGDIKDKPASLAVFDHAIAYVPSQKLFLDGTAEHSSTTELPAMDRGAVALVVSAKGSQLVRLPSPPAKESLSKRNIRATLAKDGSANVDLSFRVTGVDAPAWRSRYENSSTREVRLTEEMSSALPQFQIKKVQTSPLGESDAPVEINATGSTKRLGALEGNTWRIGIEPKGNFVRTFAPLSTRSRPIKFSSERSFDETWTFTVPKGSKARLPKTASGKSVFGSYELLATEHDTPSGHVIEITSRYENSRARIAVEEYAAFRAYCEELDRTFAQSLEVTFP